MTLKKSLYLLSLRERFCSSKDFFKKAFLLLEQRLFKYIPIPKKSSSLFLWENHNTQVVVQNILNKPFIMFEQHFTFFSFTVQNFEKQHKKSVWCFSNAFKLHIIRRAFLPFALHACRSRTRAVILLFHYHKFCYFRCFITSPFIRDSC